MTEVYASSVIAAPADQVWARVRDFNGLPSWRPLIAIETFLAHKWSKELDYRLIGELWAFTDNRIAVRFTSEYHDIRDAWYRAYGGEHWEFDLDGLIRRRYCSVNECPIAETGRMFLWPPGPGPHDHPQLSHFAL